MVVSQLFSRKKPLLGRYSQARNRDDCYNVIGLVSLAQLAFSLDRKCRLAYFSGQEKGGAVSPTQIPVQGVSPGEKIRCVLVHDHVLLRQGLRRLLEDEPDLEVVSEADNAAEAARKVFEFRPDVVIADAATFELPATEVELFLLRESPQSRVLFLSMLEQPGSPPSEPNAETAGCVVRQTSALELVKMVRSACRTRSDGHGRPFLASVDPQHSAEAFFPRKRSLTAREREVLKLLAEGRTVRAVAAMLNLSVKTVDAHKFNLMRKLGIHNKAELVMWAIQKRVVKIPANF